MPIEAESQDTALRIFSTLNDRGKPLSDTDIFKAQFYKFYSDQGRKEEFISRWKALEELSDKIFKHHLVHRWMNYLQDICTMKEQNNVIEKLQQKH